MKWQAALVAFALLPGAIQAQAFSAAEVELILQHGPWPPPWEKDTSNAVSGQSAAISLGQRLFFEPRLSGNQQRPCSSCHIPEKYWVDGRATGLGTELLDRNTPSIVNVRWQRWFAWDGGSDSLWAQSIRALFNPREMQSNQKSVAALIRRDPNLACQYQSVFGAKAASQNDETVLVNTGKALAAFQETLFSGRTAFDAFRDALSRGDAQSTASYPPAAQRGLRLFIGKAACNLCHYGPRFSHGEFADIGVTHFTRDRQVDSGRYGGLQALKSSRFNLLGHYNDDPTRENAIATRHVALNHNNWGEFRVPSLRQAVYTAPYMHHGRLATLRAVVRHYSDLDENRLHGEGERVLRPLRLSEEEISDLVAFLETLSGPQAEQKLPAIAACKPPAGARRP